MTLRRTEIAKISKDRLEQFGGRMPFNSLEKPDAPRTAPKAKSYVDTGPDDETVALIRRRDEEKCACCGDPAIGRRGIEWCIAHRKLRAQGIDNRPANLYLSCGNPHWGCEQLTHAHPERSRQAGRMLKSTEDPEAVPMEHAVHGTVLLLNDGTFAVIQAAVVEETDEHHPF